MLVDLLVQMLAALLVHGESAHPFAGIAQESAQGDTVIACTAEFGLTLPVLGRLNRVRRRGTQFRKAMLEELGCRPASGSRKDRLLVKGLHVRNEYRAKIVMPSIRHHVGQELRQMLVGSNGGEHADHARDDAASLIAVPK